MILVSGGRVSSAGHTPMNASGHIGAVVVMFAVVVLLAVGRETIPCICRTYRGRTHDSRGEETCISCRNHLIAPLSADALLAWLFSKRRGRCLL
jgi:hypothetical protein